MRLTLWLFYLAGIYLSACQLSQSNPTIENQQTIDTINHEQPLSSIHYPTLADFWNGDAHFVADVPNTGLPMDESDSLFIQATDENGTKDAAEIRSYLHASYQSASVHDQCGDPVEFPGSLVSRVVSMVAKHFNSTIVNIAFRSAN